MKRTKQDKIKARQRVKKDLAKKMGIPQDVLLPVPRFTLIGDSQAHIEGINGIAKFSQNGILLKSEMGMIRVAGKQLVISHLTRSTALISGDIASLTLCWQEDA